MKQIPQHTLDFIDSWLELTTKWEKTTGLALAIMYKGKVVFDKTYGTSLPQNSSEIFAYRVASHSKTFTAVAILQLQEKKQLRIDDMVVEYLPWLKEHTDDRWKLVTIRQLLSHSAGVVRDGDISGFWSLQSDFPSFEQFKNEIMAHDLVLEPNTQLKYSNFGYGLLGCIIEAVSGESYQQYVEKNIISVLGLEHTSAELSKNLLMATGYSRKNLAGKRFAFPSIPTHSLCAATGFCSTPSDLCVFFDALKVGSEKLLTDASKREMQRKQWDIKKEDDSYGLGVDIGERHGYNVIGHSGGFPGFSSRTWLDSDNDIIVSVVVTEQDTWVGPIASSVFAIFNELGDTPPENELLKYEGLFAGLNNITQIVAHTSGLRQVWPNGWWPMGSVNKLKLLEDGKTLLVYDVSGFDDEGEKLRYTFREDGTPESISLAGEVLPASTDADLKQWW